MIPGGDILDGLAADLAKSGAPQRLDAVAGRLLKSAPGPVASRILAGLLAQDGRFSVEDGWVRLLPRLDPLLDLPLGELRFAVIDFETNGLSPYDRAIEVGVACFQGGKEVGSFETLLNPGTPLSRFVISLTGIRPGDLEGKPSFAQVWPELEAALSGAVLVAHNLPFDRRILHREVQLMGGRVRVGRASLCTLALSRRLLPKEEPKGLDALVERFSLPIENRHRALGDARATGHLLYRLVDLAAEREEIHRWGDLKRFAHAGPAAAKAGAAARQEETR